MRTFKIIMMFLISVNVAIAAGPELFPFVAQVKAERVNVRAGFNENFERLTQLSSGDHVIVTGRDHGWSKVQLPSSVSLFIADKYVTTFDPTSGTIAADRVNVRVAMNVESTSVGQLVKGETVVIVRRHPGWLEIRPTEKTCGWVKDEYMAFASRDLSTATIGPAVVAVPQPEPMPVVMEPVLEARECVGVLTALAPDAPQEMSYQIVTDGKPVCYVQGLRYVLDDFRGFHVRVKGAGTSTSTLPVVVAEEAALVL